MTQESLTVNIKFWWCVNFGGTVVFFVFSTLSTAKTADSSGWNNWQFWGLKCSLCTLRALESSSAKWSATLLAHSSNGVLEWKRSKYLEGSIATFFSLDFNHLVWMSAIKITHVQIRLKQTTKKNKLVACDPGHTWNFVFSICIAKYRTHEFEMWNKSWYVMDCTSFKIIAQRKNPILGLLYSDHHSKI